MGHAEDLQAQFDRTHDPAFLAAAIEIGEAVLAADPTSPVIRGGALIVLAKCHWSRHERYGTAMETALGLFRAALDVLPDGHPMTAACRANLAGALHAAWRATSTTADLDEAITHIRLALRDTTPADQASASRLNQLGTLLTSKATASGDPVPLQESVRVLDRAYTHALLTGQAGNARTAASNLAVSLRLLAFQTDADKVECLLKAAELTRWALTVTPASDPLWARFQSNLSHVLQALYAVRNDASDLAEALEAARRAIQATPLDHPNRVERLGSYAGALQARLEVELRRAGRPPAAAGIPPGLVPRGEPFPGAGDLVRELIQAAEAVYRSTPPGHHRYGAGRALLAQARYLDLTLAGRSPTQSEEEAVSALLHDVVTDGAQRPRTRVQAAQQWAHLRLSRALTRPGEHALALGAEVTFAFDSALRLLPRVVARNLPRAVREHELTAFSGLASAAAAWSLRGFVAEPAHAVAQLEQGRNVLLGQVLDGRTDVAKLRERHPALADRYESLSHAFDRPDEVEYSEPLGGGTAVTPSWELRHRLAAEWDELIATVREQPGFEDFLELPDPGRLVAESAPHGPVVYLNAALLGCDALILRDGEVQRVELPCPFEQLRDVARDFLHATADATGGGSSLLRQGQAQRKVRDVLAWLWDEVTGPVLDALGFLDGPSGDGVLPRMWWVPTGPFTVLPLHAAGHGGDSGPDAMNHVVSSYTVGLRELARARSRPAPREPTVLTVAYADPADGRRLAALPAEVARVPAGTLLSDAEAGPGKVLAALPRHTWVHFACHASGPTGDHPQGRLELHGGDLTTADITALRLPHADLAYLSACEATQGKHSLSDEALHITAAMQTAGFRHVVGTLWEADDETCLAVAGDFYARLTAGQDDITAGGGPDPARALHAALRPVRAAYPNTPTYWANYVHYGP
ncbi:CHAT domain-containing protein [Streptomyces sp. NPDC004658]|uniref:CHAT domain-containing protein n=1 Tax=Streptomyces sp. NPDC004658 TaxID=3154672 RepID=UPI0033B2DF26